MSSKSGLLPTGRLLQRINVIYTTSRRLYYPLGFWARGMAEQDVGSHGPGSSSYRSGSRAYDQGSQTGSQAYGSQVAGSGPIPKASQRLPPIAVSNKGKSHADRGQRCFDIPPSPSSKVTTAAAPHLVRWSYKLDESSFEQTLEGLIPDANIIWTLAKVTHDFRVDSDKLEATLRRLKTHPATVSVVLVVHE